MQKYPDQLPYLWIFYWYCTFIIYDGANSRNIIRLGHKLNILNKISIYAILINRNGKSLVYYLKPNSY